MSILRPATPGFLVTLAATVCLALVVFSVPWLRSIYFLKANLRSESISGELILGTLGYCLSIGNGTEPVCSKPSIGYQFDPNAILGITERIDIPEVVVKWVTYALVLHIVALVASAGSAVFGLLAHVREMSMMCCSSCFSGLAATVALFAFIFDIVFFFLVRTRINAIGGSAQLGTGIWLTLAAWIMLFFSGCFYGFGQCCIRKRPHGPGRKAKDPEDRPYDNLGKPGGDSHAEMLRLDAMKAEADRKARQKQGEGGLPAFAEHETKPLRTQSTDEEEEEHRPYRDNSAEPRRQASMPHSAAAATGYAAAPRGTRAVDEYYSPSQQPAVAYPPQPRQYQQHNQPSHAQMASHYPEIVEPQPAPAPAPAQTYLSPGGGMGHSLYASGHSTAGHGHEARGTSYHSAHSQFPSYQEPQYTHGRQYTHDGYGGYAQDGQYAPQQSGYLPAGAQAPGGTPGAESYYTANTSASHTPTPPAMPGSYNPYSSSPPPMPVATATPAPYRQPEAENTYYSYQAASQLAAQPPPSPIPEVLRVAPARQPSGPAPRGPRSPTSPTSPTGGAGGWPPQQPPRQQSLPSDQPPSYESGPASSYNYYGAGKTG